MGKPVFSANIRQVNQAVSLKSKPRVFSYSVESIAALLVLQLSLAAQEVRIDIIRLG
jgi:hypothetical protein